MADFLDHYIASAKNNNFSKKISNYFNEKMIDFKSLLNKAMIQFEILKIKLELRKNYINLGKFISKNYNKENIVDFSYKDDFFNINHEINKSLRYIRKLENKD
tara:strand:+ start:2076 stop:2384 length:309 start_codon:yes stop_codon:yes gene_type:complete